MKKIRALLKKCKSLSAALGRSSSYTSLRSKSTKSQDLWRETKEVGGVAAADGGGGCGDVAIVFVGSSHRRYMIRAKYLSHPVIRALVDNSRESSEDSISVKCEVVLFDHLLWMLENGSLEAVGGGSSEEVAALYAY